MKKYVLALLLTMPVMHAATADGDHASEASVRELMSIMQSQKLLDGVIGKMDSMMQMASQQALGGQTITPEQQKIIDDSRTKMISLFKDEMKWETIEPTLVDIYEQSFTQQELDGMLAFYKSPAGQAVIAKMPVVMQNSMLAMQKQLATVMPKMQQLQKDMIAQLKAAKKSS